MRHALGNDDYVTFGYLMCLPAFNFGAADFVRRDLLRIDCFSTCDERGRAIDDINDISIKRVGFLKRTAVRALPIEMVAPIAKLPSSRSSAIRLPPSSTMAITPPGALFFLA